MLIITTILISGLSFSELPFAFAATAPPPTTGCPPALSPTRSASSEINAKYQQYVSVLGAPLTGVISSGDNIGSFRLFEHGAIYWSPMTCAHELHEKIWKKWDVLDRERYGYPTTDQLTTSDGRASYNLFNNGGAIYLTKSGAYETHGEILTKWNQLNQDGIFLGYPLTDQLTKDNTGAYNDFEQGSIFWSPTTGAHYLNGPILEKYKIMNQNYGYPTTDPLMTGDNVATYNLFSNNGAIYWTLATGAHEMHDDIYEKWSRDNLYSKLGYPIKDQQTRDGIGGFSQFQHGNIYWSPTTGAHWIYDNSVGNELASFEPKFRLLDKYLSEGAELGHLGYPTGDQATAHGKEIIPPPPPCNNAACIAGARDTPFVPFEHGYIYQLDQKYTDYSGQQVGLFPEQWTGAHVMDGAFRLLNICIDSFTVNKSHDDRGAQDLVLSVAFQMDQTVFGRLASDVHVFNLADPRIAKFEESATVERAPYPQHPGFAEYDLSNNRFAGCRFGIPVDDSSVIGVVMSGLESDEDSFVLPGIQMAGSALNFIGVPVVGDVANAVATVPNALLHFFGVHNLDEAIGEIKDFYNSHDNFGDGPHEILSRSVNEEQDGDITLRYYISALELDLTPQG